MLAKQATKLIEDHLEGKVTTASKTILSEIAGKAVEAGFKGPFKIKKVSQIDDFLSGPQSDEFIPERHEESPSKPKGDVARELISELDSLGLGHDEIMQVLIDAYQEAKSRQSVSEKEPVLQV